MSKILITGTAGFIGFYLADKGLDVVGLDNLSPLPESHIKDSRLAQLGFDTDILEYNKLQLHNNYQFIKLDLNDTENLNNLFKQPRENDILDNNDIPFQILSVGNNTPVKVIDLIKEVEKALGKKAIIENKPLQAGEMLKTYADIDKLCDYINYSPDTLLSDGIEKTANWYKSYCN